jgi:hypothetical protein
LIGFAPKDEQVNISHEVRKIFVYFVIGDHFGVVAAAIQGDVDCVDYISHFRHSSGILLLVCFLRQQNALFERKAQSRVARLNLCEQRDRLTMAMSLRAAVLMDSGGFATIRSGADWNA